MGLIGRSTGLVGHGHYSFHNNDAIGYGRRICDKLTAAHALRVSHHSTRLERQKSRIAPISSASCSLVGVQKRCGLLTAEQTPMTSSFVETRAL